MDLTLFDTLYRNMLDSTWLEAVAVLFGLMSVWFAKKENILVYPTGIINVLIYVYICFHVKLYADMSINAFYFAMSIYGWYKWTRKDARQHNRPIARASRKENILSMIGALIFFIISYFILKNFTDSTVPYWDAFTTALFIIGMWMMALKKIENWVYWIIGDLLVIPLFAYKGLVLTSVQYTIFLALAISGYIEWRRKLITHHSSLITLNLISITGPESTGKSSLAEALARHYGTVWAEEYAREYLAEIGRSYGYEDIVKIAQGQLLRENKRKEAAVKFLFCDTDLLVCKIWSEFRYGKADPWIQRMVEEHRYDLYLLCDIDLPWEEDPLREHPHRRKELFDLYLYELKRMKLPYEVVTGTGIARVNHAISIIERTFTKNI